LYSYYKWKKEIEWTVAKFVWTQYNNFVSSQFFIPQHESITEDIYNFFIESWELHKYFNIYIWKSIKINFDKFKDKFWNNWYMNIYINLINTQKVAIDDKEYELNPWKYKLIFKDKLFLLVDLGNKKNYLWKQYIQFNWYVQIFFIEIKAFYPNFSKLSWDSLFYGLAKYNFNNYLKN